MTPFYEKCRALWQAVQERQIKKGMEKYPEPFDPHSWTSSELVDHALEESVDLVHYLVGLKEQLERKERMIDRLLRDNLDLELRLLGINESQKKPPYADLDD